MGVWGLSYFEKMAVPLTEMGKIRRHGRILDDCGLRWGYSVVGNMSQKLEVKL